MSKKSEEIFNLDSVIGKRFNVAFSHFFSSLFLFA